MSTSERSVKSVLVGKVLLIGKEAKARFQPTELTQIISSMTDSGIQISKSMRMQTPIL
jgi:hypothetical protein